MSFENAFADGVIRHRSSLLVISFLLFVASVIGAKNLVLSTDSRIYFGPDNPQLIDFEKLEDNFSKARNILVLIHSENEPIFSQNKLQLVNDFTEEAWTIPHSYRVDSVANFQHSEAGEEELVTVRGDFSDAGDRDAVTGLPDVRVVSAGDDRIVLAVRDNGSVDVLAKLFAGELAPSGVSIEPPSLNSLFLKLTGKELRD